MNWYLEIKRELIRKKCLISMRKLYITLKERNGKHFLFFTVNTIYVSMYLSMSICWTSYFEIYSLIVSRQPLYDSTFVMKADLLL